MTVVRDERVRLMDHPMIYPVKEVNDDGQIQPLLSSFDNGDVGYVFIALSVW